jgi:membrane associated rhomboid family serine protease
MFPLRDTIPRERAPVVTVLLIVASVAAFAFELSLAPERLGALIELNGLVPRRYTDPGWARATGFPGADPWPFLTSMFLHGGWLHLLSNVWTLWIFGDNVEDRLGPLRYLAFYLLAGLAAGAVHVLTSPLSAIPTIGASGAIAGVMGAYLVLHPRGHVITLVPVLFYPVFVRLPAVLFLGLWFLLQVLSGAGTVGSTELGGVAWWAHVGGFVAGILLLFALRPSHPPGPGSGDSFENRAGSPRAPL